LGDFEIKQFEIEMKQSRDVKRQSEIEDEKKRKAQKEEDYHLNQEISKIEGFLRDVKKIPEI